MRKNLLTALICLCMMAVKAQDRATSWNEYNYLTSGKFSFRLPGYRLQKTAVDQSYPYSDGTREIVVWEFYRPNAGTPCALLLEYKNSTWGTTYLCVPDIGSGPQMWEAYRQKLRDINSNAGMNALELIAYTMSVYAAGH